MRIQNINVNVKSIQTEQTSATKNVTFDLNDEKQKYEMLYLNFYIWDLGLTPEITFGNFNTVPKFISGLKWVTS